MTPEVEEALDHLLIRMSQEHLAEYHRLAPCDFAKAHAIISRSGVLAVVMMTVAARSKTPAELRARLMRLGALPEVPIIEWYYANGHGYRDMSPPAWFTERDRVTLYGTRRGRER
jgi:hypothetical protein